MIKVLSVQPDDIVIGGVQKRSIAVANQLNKNMFLTEFMVAKAKGDKPFSNLARNQGYKCHEYNGVYRPSRVHGYKSLLRNIKWLLMMPVSIISAYRIIKGTKCDIVHINGFLNLIPLIASKLASKKVIFHLIGDHYPKWAVQRLHFLLILADKRLFIANKLQTYYLESANTRNTVVYEPIRYDLSSASSVNTKDITDEFNISDYDYVIGNVANYTPAKDWLSFIEIANKLIKDYPDTNFLFLCVGSKVSNHNSYFEKLEQAIINYEIQDSFVFTGYRNDVLEFISVMNVFLMPSTMEGTPISILEAFMVSTPVIASDVGGISEQIIDGKNGFICSSKNIRCFYEKLKYLLFKHELQVSLNEEAFIRLQKLFSLDTHVKKMESIYINLINK